MAAGALLGGWLDGDPHAEHTPGHQSVEVDTTAGPALMVGDACLTIGMFDGEAPREGMMEDVSTFHHSLDKLRRLQPAALHFCHDNRTWHRPMRD